MLLLYGTLEKEAVITFITTHQLLVQQGVQQRLIRIGVPHQCTHRNTEEEEERGVSIASDTLHERTHLNPVGSSELSSELKKASRCEMALNIESIIWCMTEVTTSLMGCGVGTSVIHTHCTSAATA